MTTATRSSAMLNESLVRRARASAAKGVLATIATAGVAVGLPSAGVPVTVTVLAMAATLGTGLAAVAYGVKTPKPGTESG